MRRPDRFNRHTRESSGGFKLRARGVVAVRGTVTLGKYHSGAARRAGFDETGQPCSEVGKVPPRTFRELKHAAIEGRLKFRVHIIKRDYDVLVRTLGELHEIVTIDSRDVRPSHEDVAHHDLDDAKQVRGERPVEKRTHEGRFACHSITPNATGHFVHRAVR